MKEDILTIQDIEKAGFKSIKQIYVGYYSFISNTFNTDYGFFTEATLHFPIKTYRESSYLNNTFTKIYVHRGYREGNEINECSDYAEDNKVFEGVIETVKDLKIIIKQLSI